MKGQLSMTSPMGRADEVARLPLMRMEFRQVSSLQKAALLWTTGATTAAHGDTGAGERAVKDAAACVAPGRAARLYSSARVECQYDGLDDAPHQGWNHPYGHLHLCCGLLLMARCHCHCCWVLGCWKLPRRCWKHKRRLSSSMSMIMPWLLRAQGSTPDMWRSRSRASLSGLHVPHHLVQLRIPSCYCD